MEKNLYEIRVDLNSNALRGIYFQVKRNNYFISHGFRKKTRQTPIRELAVGVKLAELRKKTGLTQKELAQKVNKPQSTISRVETGELNPSIELLAEIAQGLGKKMVLTFE